MQYIIYLVRLFFFFYTLMLLMRVISSWFPKFERAHFVQFIARYVDPYLNFFRRFIPLIGGVLDLSPLIAFITLQLLEKLILTILLYAIR